MKKALILLIVLFLVSFVSAECFTPRSSTSLAIIEDTILCKGEYYLPYGIQIVGDNIHLDCNGAIINGNNSKKIPLNRYGYDNTSIENCKIYNYQSSINEWADADNSILRNNYFFNIRGIVVGGENDIIEKNHIIQSGFGIYLSKASNSLISKNEIDSIREGIFLFMSYNNTIIKNDIKTIDNPIVYITWYSSNNQ